MVQTWVEQVNRTTLGIAEKVAQGFHAIPKPNKDNPLAEMPSVHRLLNVVGMVGGFATTQYLTNIIFGCKINGSHCEEIKKEDVPAPLRFLHGTLEYNPFSDAPRDQWMKVMHQMLPAMGGAFGAVKGSEFFFMHHNKGEVKFNELMKKDKLNAIDADAAASFVQGKEWRKVAGLTAWLSSATGLTVLYGVALNSAFMLCNGAKISGFKFLRGLTSNPSTVGWGPKKGLEEVLKGTQRALNDGHTEEFAKQLVETAIEPLKHLSDREKEALVQQLRTTFEQNAAQGPNAAELSKLMDSKVKEIIQNTPAKDIRLGDNGILSIVERLPFMADHIGKVRAKFDKAANDYSSQQRA